MKTFFLLLAMTLLLPMASQAKIFRNAYVAFELPPNWKCSLEQTEWVCRSQFDKEAREAIIILTAKEKGPTDSFNQYSLHLKTPRTIPSRSGKKISSKIIHVKKVKINNQPWVDGWHLNSEVPNYYTRYLATIKDRIAILVTFSAHKKFYTKYSKDFFKAIKSLRVIATKQLLERPKIANIRPGDSQQLGGSIGALMPGGGMDGGDDFPEEESGDGGGGTTTMLGLILILAAAGGYFYYKKKMA